MKKLIFKITSIFLLLFLIIGAGCKKDKIEYADENIEISSYPYISIYKTNQDYLNKIAVGVDSSGKVTSFPDYSFDSDVITVDKYGEVTLKNRYRLKSGYVLDFIGHNDVFTDVTITEMCKKNEAYGPNYWLAAKLQQRIIDKNPFVEFYYFNGINKTPRMYTIGEINEMIDDGTLEAVFTKLK